MLPASNLGPGSRWMPSPRVRQKATSSNTTVLLDAGVSEGDRISAIASQPNSRTSAFAQLGPDGFARFPSAAAAVLCGGIAVHATSKSRIRLWVRSACGLAAGGPALYPVGVQRSADIRADECGN